MGVPVHHPFEIGIFTYKPSYFGIAPWLKPPWLGALKKLHSTSPQTQTTSKPMWSATTPRWVRLPEALGGTQQLSFPCMAAVSQKVTSALSQLCRYHSFALTASSSAPVALSGHITLSFLFLLVKPPFSRTGAWLWAAENMRGTGTVPRLPTALHQLKDRITPHVNFFQQAAKER